MKAKPIILCVDDDQDTLDLLRIALESGGYQVVTAPTAEDGRKKFKSEKPDLVIVDLMMEEVDSGTGLVMKLKAGGNVAPVFMLSSVGDSLSRNIDAGELGLAGIFQKPLEPRTLLATVKARLEKK